MSKGDIELQLSASFKMCADTISLNRNHELADLKLAQHHAKEAIKAYGISGSRQATVDSTRYLKVVNERIRLLEKADKENSEQLKSHVQVLETISHLSDAEIYERSSEVSASTREALKMYGKPRLVPHIFVAELNAKLCAMFIKKLEHEKDEIKLNALYAGISNHLSFCVTIAKILSYSEELEGASENFCTSMRHVLSLQNMISQSAVLASKFTPSPARLTKDQSHIKITHDLIKTLDQPITTEDLSELHPLIRSTLSRMRTDIKDPQKVALIAEVFKQGLQLVAHDEVAAMLLSGQSGHIFIHEDRRNGHIGFCHDNGNIDISVAQIFEGDKDLTSSMKFVGLLIHEFAHKKAREKYDNDSLPYTKDDVLDHEIWIGIKKQIIEAAKSADAADRVHILLQNYEEEEYITEILAYTVQARMDELLSGKHESVFMLNAELDGAMTTVFPEWNAPILSNPIATAHNGLTLCKKAHSLFPDDLTYQKCLVVAHKSILSITNGISVELSHTIDQDQDTNSQISKVAEVVRLIDIGIEAIENILSPEFSEVATGYYQSCAACLKRLVGWRDGIQNKYAHLSCEEEAKEGLAQDVVSVLLDHYENELVALDSGLIAE